MWNLRQWDSMYSKRRIAIGRNLVLNSGGDAVCILHGPKVSIVLRGLGRRHGVPRPRYWHGRIYRDEMGW